MKRELLFLKIHSERALFRYNFEKKKLSEEPVEEVGIPCSRLFNVLVEVV